MLTEIFTAIAAMFTPTPTTGIFPVMLVALVTWHFIADYPLQGEWLARAKNPNLQLIPGETNWPMAITGHSLIHAAGVYVITGSLGAAMAEFILHGVIDLLKCDRVIGYNTDQALHIGLKVVYFMVV